MESEKAGFFKKPTCWKFIIFKGDLTHLCHLVILSCSDCLSVLLCSVLSIHGCTFICAMSRKNQSTLSNLAASQNLHKANNISKLIRGLNEPKLCFT